MPFVDEIPIELPLFRTAVEHWERLRGARPWPARRDLDPVEIPKLLANSLLIDVIDGGADFRYRLIGSSIDAAVRNRLKGKLLSEIPDRRPPSRVHALYSLAATERRIVHARMPYGGQDPRITGAFAMNLPLGDGPDAVDTLWGLVYFERPLLRP